MAEHINFKKLQALQSKVSKAQGRMSVIQAKLFTWKELQELYREDEELTISVSDLMKSTATINANP